MRFTITRDALKGLLAAVTPAVPSRSTLPVLSHVLLEAEGDTLRATGTDLDLAVRTQAPARDVTDGAICAPLAKLRDLANQFPAGDVSVELAGSELVLRFKGGRFKLNAIPADDFPGTKWPSFADAWTVPTAELLGGVDLVAFAASTEETRPILNGVLWHLRDGEMWWVATNGHRLARASMPAPQGAEAVFGGKEAILHPRALTLARSLFAGAPTMEVSRTETHLALRAGESVLVARTIEGPYPNYDQILPRENNKELVVDVAALRQAVGRVAVLANDQTHRIAAGMAPGAGLTLSVETPDHGSAEEVVGGDYTGDELRIGFNANYLAEILKKVETKRVRWTFSAPERVAEFLPVDQDGSVRTGFLVMPLRLLD